jgi:signal transduction histidine kinase
VEDLQNENEELKKRLEQFERLANVGTSTAMIAHEINNLLTPLSNYAQLALQHKDDEKLKEKALEKTRRNCTRASDFMKSILDLTSPAADKKENVNLGQIVSEAFKCLGRDFSKDGIRVKTDIPEDLNIPAVKVQILQVIINLVLNARDSMLSSGGSLTVKAEESGEDGVNIMVSDTGEGINSEELAKIFEPFFTTKQTDNGKIKTGNGLGLAYCKRIVDQHNGLISVNSVVGEGTTFYICLPLTPN